MRISGLLFLLLVAGIVVTGPATTAQAAGPRNPYSSSLSRRGMSLRHAALGINWSAVSLSKNHKRIG